MHSIAFSMLKESFQPFCWELEKANAIPVILNSVSEEQLDLEGVGWRDNDDITPGRDEPEAPSMPYSLAKAIRIFASDDRAKSELRHHNGFDVLMKLSENRGPEVQEEVAWAIGVLASDADTETCLVEIGAIDKLLSYTKALNEQVILRANWSLGMLTPKAIHYNEILKQRGNNAAGNADGEMSRISDTVSAKSPVSPQFSEKVQPVQAPKLGRMTTFASSSISARNSGFMLLNIGISFLSVENINLQYYGIYTKKFSEKFSENVPEATKSS